MSLLSVQREGAGPTFVWLHGFTQSRASAHQFRSILTGTRELLTLDLPGHGSASALKASLDETADLVMDALDGQHVALGGYSFGARVALHVALRHPGSLNQLVLLGATRGIENERERLERRERDEALAKRIEEIGGPAFLDEWLAQPMFAALPPDPLERSARSTHAEGLANSLRVAGTGTQAWLAPQLSGITVPTLTLAGGSDLKFAAEATAIAKGVARGSSDVVDAAGHAAHLEQPELTAQRITSFLESFDC
jgi:2-succinyl-6-hydroxy-2,4-cyclohexadiene-1-carboxylate synthase